MKTLSEKPYRREARGHHTDCWVWQRAMRKEGYGAITIRGRMHVAHRVYYERARGPIPAGMVLDHLCRVTSCVNPDHLEPVTQGENVRRSSTAKLTEAQVVEIRKSADDHKALAERFGVSSRNIDAIKAGRTWKDAGRPDLCHVPTMARKLTREAADRIRDDPRTGAAIAAEHGISRGTVYAIKTNRIWKKAA